MSDTNIVSRRKALARISALAIGAYVIPTALTISKAHAKNGSSGGGSTHGSSTSGSTHGSSTSGSSTHGATSGSSTHGATSGSRSRRNSRRRRRR